MTPDPRTLYIERLAERRAPATIASSPRPVPNRITEPGSGDQKGPNLALIDSGVPKTYLPASTHSRSTGLYRPSGLLSCGLCQIPASVHPCLSFRIGSIL